MNTLYAHSAHVFGKPRVTVAGIVVDDILVIGVASCSTKDIYVRKRGNAMAQGRAKSNPASETGMGAEYVRKGKRIEIALDPEKPLIGQFLTVANTIIAQIGGVVKLPKKKTGTVPPVRKAAPVTSSASCDC